GSRSRGGSQATQGGTVRRDVTETPGPVFGRRDPDRRGYFGEFGGPFVPETLVAPVEALETAYLAARSDPEFVAAFRHLLATYVGRPTPLQEARRATSGTTVR